MDNLWFQKTTITQIQYINVQQILVITFVKFTGATRGFMIMYCAARGVKKVGQHWSSSCSHFLQFFHIRFLEITRALYVFRNQKSQI